MHAHIPDKQQKIKSQIMWESQLGAEMGFNPLAYTDVPETAGLARSINTQPAVRHNSETNPTSQHNRGMY